MLTMVSVTVVGTRVTKFVIFWVLVTKAVAVTIQMSFKISVVVTGFATLANGQQAAAATAA